MFSSILKLSKREDRHLFIAAVIGIITGVLSAFVKSGTESILPPRTLDRIAPPVKMIEDTGVNVNDFVYTYSEQIVHWGGNGIHIIFSIAVAVVYCVASELFPRIKMLQGLIFAVIVMVVFHGIVLPTLKLSPAVWNLPFDEVFSEVIGTLLWMWSIELLRMNLRYRITKQADL
ncbi:putative membrane protein [Providencia alcalifaciens]|nr:putative membrane protein [Providencia alcalifaciens]